MSKHITRALLALAITVFAAGCTAAAAKEPSEDNGTGAPPFSTQTAALGECARPDIVLGTPLQASAVDQAAAQVASGRIGVRGPASVAVLMTVTVGTRTGAVATPGDALVDAQGLAIVDRPAWVMVFKNQAVRMPSNGVYVPGAVQAGPPPTMSVLATVIDAQTGSFLRGWGCAFGK